MSEIFGTIVDFNKNEIQNVKLQNLITFPVGLGPADQGCFFWHSVNKLMYMWDGTAWLEGGGGAGAQNTVTEYRSDYESLDEYVYAGYLLNAVITITKTKDSIVLNAQSLTDLDTDWNNRLALTYI